MTRAGLARAGVRIGTAERDSTFLSQGLALKTALDRVPALAPVEVSASAHASVENANRLAADDIDFGFMASNWIGRAKNGEAPFKKKIGLRMVAPMNAGPLFFIARADSDLTISRRYSSISPPAPRRWRAAKPTHNCNARSPTR
jgi:TRAP-type uncharacterized transport system substrate-binding protein